MRPGPQAWRTRVLLPDNGPMNFVRLLPIVLSSLLLAAHFYRAGQQPLVLLALLLPLLLGPSSKWGSVTPSWVPQVVTTALLLGALEWVYTLAGIAIIRIEFGAPWGRMALILGAVAALTALSTLVFRTDALRRRYAGSHQGRHDPSA